MPGQLQMSRPRAWQLPLVLLAMALTVDVAAEQHPLVLESSAWGLEINPTWDILGPFPQRAREHHFLSPVFPFHGGFALNSCFL